MQPHEDDKWTQFQACTLQSTIDINKARIHPAIKNLIQNSERTALKTFRVAPEDVLAL